jgi:nicotinate-nucleotide pyrophosphorylase (carboxylating)
MQAHIDALIRLSLEEDIGTGDITTVSTIPPDAKCTANVLAKSDVVVAGIPFFARVFEMLNPAVTIEQKVAEGQFATCGEVLATVSGPTQSVLTGERVALNILQRLSGVATMTARYATALKGTNARVVDTRKTTPGMRALQKYAVRMGGGSNHRFGLDSGILIKDNHIAACGTITTAIERVRERAPHLLRIEVEVTNMEEISQAIEAKADVILLDNMSTEMMADAVRQIKAAPHPIITEASGNVTLARIGSIAQTGVDFVSVGALTHSVVAADISLDILS